MIDGSILIGDDSRQRDDTFTGVDPSTDAALGQSFSIATEEDVTAACALAGQAAASFGALDPESRAHFLEDCGEREYRGDRRSR